MTYEQWVGLEASGRCSRLQAHGMTIYWPSREERQWLAQYDELRRGGWWSRWLRQTVVGSLLVTAELASQVGRVEVATRVALAFLLLFGACTADVEVVRGPPGQRLLEVKGLQPGDTLWYSLRVTRGTWVLVLERVTPGLQHRMQLR